MRPICKGRGFNCYGCDRKLYCSEYVNTTPVFYTSNTNSFKSIFEFSEEEIKELRVAIPIVINNHKETIKKLEKDIEEKQDKVNQYKESIDVLTKLFETKLKINKDNTPKGV